MHSRIVGCLDSVSWVIDLDDHDRTMVGSTQNPLYLDSNEVFDKGAGIYLSSDYGMKIENKSYVSRAVQLIDHHTHYNKLHRYTSGYPSAFEQSVASMIQVSDCHTKHIKNKSDGIGSKRCETSN
ncbi:unnamed protein product [Acanthoscelides obtectus]|uniref:Uncharacterized protein n=1 Tax=Acanthoscelides obtectus TaxID=200917 RepID=A0A9P0P1T7_ACAOB|nr:unnamed protein product [Acanthoscelides obtectus]CAK1653032.1 hypothetical protein AOBTE_LOCUS18021 [Acanthoscelides obtectus]